MGAYQPDQIRNVALVGHSGAGKTTLGEAILHKAGLTTRLGSVDDGTTVLDYDDESKDRRHTVDSALCHLQHEGHLLNFIDTPGMPDYCGQAIAAIAAVETAAVVVSAAAGIGVNTRRMFNIAKNHGLGRMIIVTRLDAENANLPDVLAAIRETFGHECHPINLPTNGGKGVIDVLTNTSGEADVLDVGECHTALIDAIVETDDALMEQFMETGSVPPERLAPAIGKAVASGHLIPVLFVSARHDVGVKELLDAIVRFAPSPVVGKQRTLLTGEGEAAKETPIVPKPDGEFIAQIFKITADPKSNIKYSVARVHSGALTAEGQVFIAGERKGQRPGHLLKLHGGEHAEIEAGRAGDIVAFAKLDFKIGDVLFAKAGEGRILMPKTPTPMYALALEPKARGDVEKISAALHRFAEEDPCFEYQRDAETNELVMRGLGDLHLTVVQSKMKRQFKVEMTTKAPKIPYRETISSSVKYVEYTHKKQTGGAGQFARVFIDMEPNERGKGYEFLDKIFGGVIDQSFRPSVDKGVRDQMKKGVIAGYPVVDVKVSLVDGKTHPVDSKDIAFQIAGRQVFKKAFVQCKPILLEPVVNLEVTVPTEFMGDITRDIAGKRGQIQGQDMLPGNQVCVHAQVPLAEVASYASQLKSVTGGQGSYMMELSHYDIVPPNVQQQIAAQYKSKEEEEE
ncbi:MAG TPA: elongation factor G [Phycisphaerae bacterium]|nr:elongation factor G [Phycisphaerae bacterium]